MITVPQAFLQDDALLKWMRHEQSCILEKVAKDDQPDNSRYVAQPALTVVLQGKLHLSTEAGQGVTLHPGQMVLLPIGLYFISDLIPHPRPFKAWVFFFEEALIREFLHHHGDGEFCTNPPPFEVFETPPILEKIMTGIQDQYQIPFVGPATHYKLLEVLHQMHTHTPQNRFLAGLQSICYRKNQSLLTFMEQHFDKPLKVEDYAHLTGRSASTFQRDFKRQFGASPKSWLLEKRMSNARNQLTNQPHISIRELAQQSGYDNVSHFIKVFQQRFGASPKQYQLNHRLNSHI